MRVRGVLSLFLALLGSVAVDAQPRLLSNEEYSWLTNEISGDAAYEHIRYFTQFHRPRGGAPGLMQVAEYVESRAREFGLEDVRLIRQMSSNRPWFAEFAELSLTSPGSRKVASTIWHPLYLSDYSRTTRIEDAPIIYVRAGVSDSEYAGKDVSGAIVLAHGSTYGVTEEAVWKRGALGIITFPDPGVAGYPENSLDRPDQLRWTSIPDTGRDGKEGTFGFRLTARQGLELVNLVERESDVRARVEVRSTFGDEKWQVMVEAFLRGSEIADQDILITGHLQEEKYSANDDASGCANVLEIARALKRLLDEGRLPRPKRNLRFWWVTEISSQRQFFADHPRAHESMMANINQDMVGANQSQDVLRVQNMTRLPFSRFHFLNDVAESILEDVIEGNRSNLAVVQAGGEGLYPRPILASLGSRHRYSAAMVPFHNSTDHMPFNEAPIGVPGITLTNWPDNFIHSTDDDLWNIDRTQLQRNAFVVAAVAWVMANAGPESFDRIASEVAGRASQRLSEDFRLALGWIAEDRNRYHEGLHQLDQAVKREMRAAASLDRISTHESHLVRIRSTREMLEETGLRMKRHLEQSYREISGQAPPQERLTPAEAQLKNLVPRVTAGPAEFLERRSRIERVRGLHDLMAFEVLNFIDGERNGLEILRAVAAEARRAGRHYYGDVAAEDVLAYLENVRKAGLVSLP